MEHTEYLTDTLSEALDSNLTVAFVYDTKFRIIEVHAIGTSTKDGSHIMRGYQVAGESSRPLPCWALFTLSKIDTLELGFVPSEAPRPGYAMNDKQMATIINQISMAEVV